MSVDAVALLRIRKLTPAPNALGIAPHVVHRGDASLFATFTRFGSLAADELSLALRHSLGALLDRHDDPRGILFFPDTCEPRGKRYEAIVKEVERAGVWAPNVTAGHVPARFASSTASSHEALVAALIAQMGRDEALQFDLLAQVHALGMSARTPGAAEALEEHLKPLRASLGAPFEQRYHESVVGKAREQATAQQAQFDAMSGLAARLRARS